MEIDEARGRLAKHCRENREFGVKGQVLTDIETLLAAHEIQWDGERSIEYTLPETVALMAQPKNIGTLRVSRYGTGRTAYSMSRGGTIDKYLDGDYKGVMRGLPRYENFVCIGCQTCYPDAPDEAECPECGRPLDPYPHFYESGGSSELHIVTCGERSIIVDVELNEVDVNPLGEDHFKDHGRYSRITAEETRELRERVQYPRVFVPKNPHTSAICWRLWPDSVERYGNISSKWCEIPIDVEDMPRSYMYEVTGLITPEELLEGARRERCRKCRGKGRITGYEGGTAFCSRCYGSGVEPEGDKPDGGEEPCPICNGHGRHIVRIGESSWETQECPECGGDNE